MTPQKERVAVIGLGAYGLVALKNMLEVGFGVVGYDQNPYIGGLWMATSDPTKTSVLTSTVSNISKQRNCFTDLPFGNDIPDHPTSAQVQQYLEQYADHFQLRSHFRLGTTVTSIRHSHDKSLWTISSKGSDSVNRIEVFDKVIIATGTFHSPTMPQIPGIENFEGQVLHSQSFKNPSDFNGKNVVVLGLSNSGADTTVELCKVAAKVYISHRSGARILLRKDDKGNPADHQATRHLVGLADTLEKISPALKNSLISGAMEKLMRKNFPSIDPAWNLFPAPPPSHSTPVVNDHIISLLSNGAAISSASIAKVTGSKSIMLTDGSTLDKIDAIIFCTGYRSDFSILAPDLDPTGGSTPEYDAAPFGSSIRRYARLYQGIFSPKYPDSLAFIAPYLIISAFAGTDVVSQAIALVFSGAYRLPPQIKIERWCDAHYAWSVKQAHIARAPIGLVRGREVEKWLNQVCANGLNEKLGWGWEGWSFWWREKELSDLLLKGVNTGFAYRLFDGRRKKWDGAKEAIYKANGRPWTET